jgi:lipopolysaccharide biosynthesis glycosyltransferase
MGLYDLFTVYDRIISLDSDVILSRNLPNLFNVVPENRIGSVFEDVGTRLPFRRDSILKVQKLFKDIGWRSGYINTGVFIVSRIHRECFRSYNGKFYTDWGSDDVHIGFMARLLGFSIYELDFRFNHMTMFSEEWNGFADRFKSFIIHYAGEGKFNPKLSRLENLLADYKKIYG